MDVEITHVVGAPMGEPIKQDESGTPLARRSSESVTTLSGPPVQVVDHAHASLADAARARAAVIAANRAKGAGAKAAPAAEAKPAEPAPAPAAAAPAQPAEPAAEEEVDEDDPDLQPAAKAAAPAAETPTAAAEPEELAQLRDTIARQTKLLEQLHAQAASSAKGEVDAAKARAELLQKSSDAYLDNPAHATRAWLAGAIGASDPASEEVTAELDDLIADLIAARRGVALDDGYTAKRKSALLQRAWNQEKQRASDTNRESEDQKQRTDQERRVQTAHQTIAKQFEASGDKYQQLHQAHLLDGPTPESRIEGKTIAEKIFTVIRTGVQLGTLDPNMGDDRLFNAAAAIAEKFYKGRAEHLRTALSTGTAAPSPSPAQQAGAPAANVDGSKARQGHGSRTLTNADASVAPAGTGKQPAAPQTPKQETSAEKRARVIREHFPNHPAARSR